jgi:hypothetical protein
MDKSVNVGVIAFPKTQYDKEWLDNLKDEELSETALADADSLIWPDLQEFQHDLHLKGAGRNIIDLYWVYFLTDKA